MRIPEDTPVLRKRARESIGQEAHMNPTTTNWIVLAVILLLILCAAAAWMYTQRRRQSERLKGRFGPEYERTINKMGDRTKAEMELREREKRVEGFAITTLTPSEAARFAQAWNTLQGRFVDNPNGVVVQADHLVYELMQKRGYPMGDFERRAADISVDHPSVVANYRAARAIALRDERGEADTEDLRKALVHYRALFDELLEVRKEKQGVLSSQQVQVNS
jgi:hypothetical protein